MNIQQMMAQAQKIQRDMQKKLEEIEKTEFTHSANGGAVTVTMLGTRQIVSINIDKDILDPSDKEMIEDIIALTINTLITQIDEAVEKVNSSVKMPGF